MKRSDESRGEAPVADWLYRSNGVGFVMLALAVGFAAVTLTVGCDCEDPLRPSRLTLLALALVPWVLDLFPIRVPQLAFAALVIVPVAALTWHGEDDFAFMFLSLMSGRVGAVATPVELAVAAGASIAVAAVNGPPGAWPYWVAAVILGAMSGRLLNAQRRLLLRLESAQDELRRAAAAEERRRIARDIHDVIAHSMTVTMLHVTAARMALENDPREAAESLEEAERTGRQSLADIRRTVGLLRRGDETEEPPAGAGDIATLVEGYRAAGLDVTMRVNDDPATIPPAAGVALYRIAQESLANAVKHAPGATVAVELGVDPSLARIVVTDRGGARDESHPASPGSGLAGMRERAELLGGTFRAGPTADGWEVRCEIPASDVAEAAPSDVPRTSGEAELQPAPGGAP